MLSVESSTITSPSSIFDEAVLRLLRRGAHHRGCGSVVELKSQIQLHHLIRSTIGKGVMKIEELLSATGADLVYAPGI